MSSSKNIKKIKYAIQTVQKDFRLDEPFFIDVNTFVTSDRLLQKIESENTAHWVKWLGTLRMEEMQKANSYIVHWFETDTPEVCNDENQRLMNRLDSPWHALLLLKAKDPEHGEVHRFTGTGEFEGKDFKITTIRSMTSYPRVIRSFYMTSEEYYKGDFYSDYLKETSLLKEWGNLTIQLDRVRNEKELYPALQDAFESLLEGVRHSSPLTAIARFVECTETIIALPRRGGGRVFADRAVFFLKDLCGKYPFLDQDTHEELKSQLIKIYDIRNNRNHGKGMMAQIPSIYGITHQQHDVEINNYVTALVAKSFYIAEYLAKSVIKHMIADSKRSRLMKNRDVLEKSWEVGDLP